MLSLLIAESLCIALANMIVSIAVFGWKLLIGENWLYKY